MNNVIDKRDMSNWIVGVGGVNFEMPVYESIPSFCDIVGMKPTKEYDLTKEKDEAMLYDVLYSLEIQKDRLDQVIHRVKEIIEHPEG